MDHILQIGLLVAALCVYLYVFTRNYENSLGKRIDKSTASEVDEQRYDLIECDNCPFPRCENSLEKELTKVQLQKMDGQSVLIAVNRNIFPVQVDVRNNKVWVVRETGIYTTYEDVKNQGGKFYEKL